MSLSNEQAEAIVEWRLQHGCTWRRVAELFCEHFPEKARELLIYPGNQECGRALTNIALDMLGEEDI
jgi:hypothetical protein